MGLSYLLNVFHYITVINFVITIKFCKSQIIQLSSYSVGPFARVKWSAGVADRSPSSGLCMELYFHTLIRLQGVHKDSFTLCCAYNKAPRFPLGISCLTDVQESSGSDLQQPHYFDPICCAIDHFTCI